jgi:hypothetical protein
MATSNAGCACAAFACATVLLPCALRAAGCTQPRVSPAQRAPRPLWDAWARSIRNDSASIWRNGRDRCLSAGILAWYARLICAVSERACAPSTFYLTGSAAASFTRLDSCRTASTLTTFPLILCDGWFHARDAHACVSYVLRHVLLLHHGEPSISTL